MAMFVAAYRKEANPLSQTFDIRRFRPEPRVSRVVPAASTVIYSINPYTPASCSYQGELGAHNVRNRFARIGVEGLGYRVCK